MLPSGEYAYVQSSSVQHLWKTKNPETTWEGGVEGEGSIVNTTNALRVPEQKFTEFNLDFHGDNTFRYREENPEWQEKWLYRTKVYNFEVEDFHTYYVGNLGAWIHSTNCYETTVAYLKKKGVLPSIDGQAFHTVRQVNATIAALANGVDATQAGFSPVVVAGPAHGTVITIEVARVAINLIATDVYSTGATLQFTLRTQPQHGSLTQSADGGYIYLASDTLTYSLSHSAVGSSINSQTGVLTRSPTANCV